jgi:hypothetical protein
VRGADLHVDDRVVRRANGSQQRRADQEHQGRLALLAFRLCRPSNHAFATKVTILPYPQETETHCIDLTTDPWWQNFQPSLHKLVHQPVPLHGLAILS